MRKASRCLPIITDCSAGGSRFPAFGAVAVIFWLMIARPPEIWWAPARLPARPLTRAVEGPATDDHRRAPDQKTDIPVDPLLPRDRLVDVVQAKQVVVDHALNDVERTEANQHRPGEEFPRPPEVRPVGGPPECDQSENDKDVGRGVEEPV